MKTRPIKTAWDLPTPPRSYSPLTHSLSLDVIIVGGGMAGVLSAHMLADAGVRVGLIEEQDLGSGATRYTTAFITQEIDTPLAELKKMFGERNAWLIWQSGKFAVDAFEELVRQKKIECEFMRCSAYRFARNEDEFAELSEDHAIAAEMGFRTELARANGLAFARRGHLKILGQAKFHPLKFLYGVAEEAVNAGAHIFEHTKAASIAESKGEVVVVTDRGMRITAPLLVLATHYPMGRQTSTRFKKGMYISYALEAAIPQGLLEEALYWDMQSPYHYFRVDKQEGHDRLVLGGADHRRELRIDSRKNFAALEEYLREVIGIREYTRVRRWRGPIIETMDGLPLIGEISPEKFVMTGFSGNGMTYSMVAAQLLHDTVLRKENPWKEIYDPKRIPTPKQLLYKTRDYGGEFFGGALKNAVRYKKTGSRRLIKNNPISIL